MFTVTEVDLKPPGPEAQHGAAHASKVLAFASVVLDGAFVVHDLKLIDRAGAPFLAMPSRKVQAHCQACHAKNHLRARFCNHCGAALEAAPAPRDEGGREKLHADVAHPITARGREALVRAVLDRYRGDAAGPHDG